MILPYIAYVFSFASSIATLLANFTRHSAMMLSGLAYVKSLDRPEVPTCLTIPRATRDGNTLLKLRHDTWLFLAISLIEYAEPLYNVRKSRILTLTESPNMVLNPYFGSSGTSEPNRLGIYHHCTHNVRTEHICVWFMLYHRVYNNLTI